MSPPRVSVVMPAYNVAPFIREAVESVLAQTYRDFELVVVDDGSTDGTSEYLAGLEDPRARVIRIAHAGIVAAQNAGMAAAHGEYLCRVDADDLVEPQMLDRLVAVLDREPRTAAVGAWHRRFGAAQAFARPPTDPRRIRRRLRTSNALAQPVLIRMDALREVGGFHDAVWEDWDLWIRLAARYDVRNVPECLSMLRFRPGSLYRAADTELRARARLEARATAARHLGVDARSLVGLGRAHLTAGHPRLERVLNRRRRSPAAPSDVMPSATVVVPTLARLPSLRRCLAAVQEQQPAPREVVVVHRPDDRETGAWLARWSASDPGRRKPVAVEAPGLVAALRAGAAAATGDVVAYLDDDAAPRPGWLAELLRGFLDPRVDAVGGPYVDHVDGREVDAGTARRVGRITWYGRVVGNHHRRTDHYGDVEFLAGANMAFRRGVETHDDRLLRSRNGLVLGNELQTCLLLRRAGSRVLFTPWAVVDHFTTSFRDPVLGSRVAGDDVCAASANYTFILLGYLPRARRVAYRLYAYLVGSATQSGPLRALVELPRSPRRARAMLLRVPAVWRGRRQGERMFRQQRVGVAADPGDLSRRRPAPARTG